jgi:hypothetical protein
MQLGCTSTIRAQVDPEIFILGTRESAAPLREQVDQALRISSGQVCVDFAGVLVSQSFMDEFLGVLISRYGPSLLHRLVLRNCTDEVRAIAQFVASVRTRELASRSA